MWNQEKISNCPKNVPLFEALHGKNSNGKQDSCCLHARLYSNQNYCFDMINSYVLCNPQMPFLDIPSKILKKSSSKV